MGKGGEVSYETLLAEILYSVPTLFDVALHHTYPLSPRFATGAAGSSRSAILPSSRVNGVKRETLAHYVLKRALSARSPIICRNFLKHCVKASGSQAFVSLENVFNNLNLALLSRLRISVGVIR